MPTNNIEGDFSPAAHQELEAVIDALRKSSRSATLLRYLAEKYFHDEGDQPSEYDIATEVFGRSKIKFDSSDDAIVRVELHRLRKKLKEFYDGPGKDHSIRIEIPHGSHLPVFSHASRLAVPENGSAHPPEGSQPGQKAGGPLPGPALSRTAVKKTLYLWISICAVVLIASPGLIMMRRAHGHGTPTRMTPIRAAAFAGSVPAASVVPARVPLRLLAGYSGEPETDSEGRTWSPDRYVHGGGPWARTDGAVRGTSNSLIFEQCRIGDFHYDIPLRPGDYELHLYFVPPGSPSDQPSTFDVRINGKLVLTHFDINSDAMGGDIADERVFRDVSPSPDGYLRVSFTSGTAAPELNALELLQGIPGKQLPIRLTMRRSVYTDSRGRHWQADNYFINGYLSDHIAPTTGSSDPNLFDMERYGHFSYSIPVVATDRYTVILHFVEFYFGPEMPGGGGSGSRVFKVMCNGKTLLDNFDIYKEAGSMRVLKKSFSHVQPSEQGKINLTFEPIDNNATVSGIEVIDEGE